MPWDKENLPDAVKNKNWTDKQIETFVKTANAVLEETKDDGESIATGIKRAEEKSNASDYPKFYYARHMQPGIAKYENETILVNTDAVKKINGTGAGKPVYVLHQTVDLDALKTEASGYITEPFYNELDGWAWFKIMVIDDEAHDAINHKKWSVSNAYLPTGFSGGGTKHNCEFDREITDGEITHLAIVPNPRYEEAIILTPEQFRIYQEEKRKQLDELKNSNPEKLQEKKSMFQFFAPRKAEEIKNADDVTDDSFVLHNGEKYTVKQIKELLNAKKNEKKNEEDMGEDKKDKKDEKKEDEKENEMCEVDGEKVNMKDLKNAYRERANMKKNEKKNKKNADADMGDDGDEFDNEDDDKDEKDKKDEKKNARHFDELKNAHKAPPAAGPVFDLGMDKLARGQAKYGSPKK